MRLQFFTRPPRRLAAAAGIAVLAFAPLMMAAAPAQAQLFGGVWGSRFSWSAPSYDDGPNEGRGYARRGMPPRAIARALADDGYRLMGPLVARGQIYLADVADGETGQRERLVIDAMSGDIIESYPLGRQFAPPGNVTRVPRADVPDMRPQPQRNARLAPPQDGGDPLVLPGAGPKPQPVKPKAALKAKAPVKPKAVIARRAPADAAKPLAPGAPATPATPEKPPLPSSAQPSDPLALPAPAEAAKPAAPDPAVAAGPPVTPLPPAAPAAEPSAASAAKDAPVQPLDDATPARKAGPPVNDIPAAPLE